MKKNKLIILAIIFILLTTISFANITDNLNVFTKKQHISLQSQIANMKNTFNINYNIYTLKNSSTIKTITNSILNKTNTIDIIFYRENENVLNLTLKFSNNLKISKYKKKISTILDKEESNIETGKVFLGTSNIVTNLTNLLVNTIGITKTLQTTTVKSNKGNKIVFSNNDNINTKNIEFTNQNTKTNRAGGIILEIIIIIIILILLYVFRHKFKRRKKEYCKYCNVQMKLISEKNINGKTEKEYKCDVCGYGRKYISK